MDARLNKFMFSTKPASFSCVHFGSLIARTRFLKRLQLCANLKPSAVPKALQVALGQRAAATPKSDPGAFWLFAGTGWKSELKKLVTHLQGDKTRPLDSPNSQNVDEVFRRYLGIQAISKHWYWPKMSSLSACDKLNQAILRSHRLAHRGEDDKPIQKKDVTAFVNHIKRLAEKTDAALAAQHLI